MDRRTSLRLLGFATLAAILGVPATLRGASRGDPSPLARPIATTERAPARPRDVADHVVGARPDSPPPPASPPPTTVEVICRDAVGLAPPRPEARPHVVTHLTLHHSGVVIDTPARVPERLRGHQRHHQAQAWPDIAYHYAVDLAGNVYELRDPARAGDTFTDYDPTGHLGVVCEGDFDQQDPTEAMFDTLADLFAHLAARHGLPITRLASHRDHTTTACPGQRLYRELATLRDAVEARLGSSPPQIVHRCGPDAEQLVEAIEGVSG